MSQFLAPIHTWLFNKIIILEKIEKDILISVDNNELREKHHELVGKFGDFIPDEPIENLIDQSNIHGWLQQRITIAESRQAAFIKELMERNNNPLEGINNIYRHAGVEIAKRYKDKIEEPTELFKALNDVLLEGMPCDRVNSIVEQNGEGITWVTKQCVHKQNWEGNGVDVAYYYGFRAAFTKGFVETISNTFEYNYSNEQEQVNVISKK